MGLLIDSPIWVTLVKEHRRWLSAFNPQYLLELGEATQSRSRSGIVRGEHQAAARSAGA